MTMNTPLCLLVGDSVSIDKATCIRTLSDDFEDENDLTYQQIKSIRRELTAHSDMIETGAIRDGQFVKVEFRQLEVTDSMLASGEKWPVTRKPDYVFVVVNAQPVVYKADKHRTNIEKVMSSISTQFPGVNFSTIIATDDDYQANPQDPVQSRSRRLSKLEVLRMGCRYSSENCLETSPYTWCPQLSKVWHAMFDNTHNAHQARLENQKVLEPRRENQPPQSKGGQVEKAPKKKSRWSFLGKKHKTTSAPPSGSHTPSNQGITVKH